MSNWFSSNWDTAHWDASHWLAGAGVGVVPSLPSPAAAITATARARPARQTLVGRKSDGAFGGRNDMRDRGLTPFAQPRQLTREQTLGDDALTFDSRGRVIIDYAKLEAKLIAMGFKRT